MSETNQTSVLIISGKSSTGKVLARRLIADGYKVALTAHSTDDATSIRHEIGALAVFFDPYRVGEIKAVLQMTRANVVVNLAPQQVNEPPFMPAHYPADVLIRSTDTLVDAVRAVEVDLLVHTSFAFLYGETNGQIVDESAPLKAAGHELFDAARLAEKHVLESGVPACVLRAGYVYSALSRSLETLTARIKAGRPTAASHNYAGWIHADDLASAIALAIQQRPAGAVFNIVDDAPATTAEFLADYTAALGIQAAGRASSPLGRLFADRTMHALLRQSSKPSNASAKSKLGWTPRFPDHNAGFEDILLTWRAAAAK